MILGGLFLALCPALLASSGVRKRSEKKVETEPVQEQLVPDLSVGPLTFGATLRGNVIATNYDENTSAAENLRFDTAWLSLALDYESWYGHTQFRYYNSSGDQSAFFHDGWLGYRWDDERQDIKAGIAKVPFGVLPFASNNYFFSLAYYVGLEDDYDFGAVYSLTRGPWTFKAAYFLREEWNGFGQSMDSARYSYDVVRSANSSNQERNQFNLWAQRTVTVNDQLTLQPGLSLMYKMIPNQSTGRDGGMWAVGVHTEIQYERFNLKLEYSHYDYDLENPPGQPGNLVVMGAYDAPYYVATEADIFVASLSYLIPIDSEFIRSVTLYNDYSAIIKSEDSFHNSQQNVTGAFLDMDPVKIYVDIALAQNDPFVGPNYSNALGTGTNDSWRLRFNINCGLYF